MTSLNRYSRLACVNIIQRLIKKYEPRILTHIVEKTADQFMNLQRLNTYQQIYALIASLKIIYKQGYSVNYALNHINASYDRITVQISRNLSLFLTRWYYQNLRLSHLNLIVPGSLLYRSLNYSLEVVRP